MHIRNKPKLLSVVSETISVLLARRARLERGSLTNNLLFLKSVTVNGLFRELQTKTLLLILKKKKKNYLRTLKL